MVSSQGPLFRVEGLGFIGFGVILGGRWRIIAAAEGTTIERTNHMP